MMTVELCRAEAAETPCQRDSGVACWYNIGSGVDGGRDGAETPLAASENFYFV